MMDIQIGRNRFAYQSYGFDDIALIPGMKTIDPVDTEISMHIGQHKFELPILASAMDSTVDLNVVKEIHRLGGLAVMNMQGIQTKFENPEDALEKIRTAPVEKSTEVIQKLAAMPVQDELVVKRVKEIKEAGCIACGSFTPLKADSLGMKAVEAGLDILVIQSTVTSLKHESSRFESLSLKEICAKVGIPVIIGNCVTYDVALEIMRAGASGILVGIGPGATCTTRGVLAVGAGQVTSTADTAAARDDYFKESGRYVQVITDGGISKGGDVVKAFASGADAVMIGTPFARANESPGRGFHWGMATGHPTLPRGTRIEVKKLGTLEQLIVGPAVNCSDGSLNLVGALREAMGVLGCRN
ncbi:MAG: GuaB3 family IMP dehydrogenase-related protein, partial [bacterium]